MKNVSGAIALSLSLVVSLFDSAEGARLRRTRTSQPTSSTAPTCQIAPALAQRAWRAAILTVSDEERILAEYIKQRSSETYPLVQIDILNVNLPADLSSASGYVEHTVMYQAVRNAIDPVEKASGKRFQMIQLLHQFPHHVRWPGTNSPGAVCGVMTQNLFSPESVIAAGIDAAAATDSPASFAFGNGVIPFSSPLVVNQNWRMDYIVTRLDGVSFEDVREKIDLAHGPAFNGCKTVAVIDTMGKMGAANNNSNGALDIDTYWERAAGTDGGRAVSSVAKAYGFESDNAYDSYLGDVNKNNRDECDEAGYKAYSYGTNSANPVSYLATFGHHSNGDGKCGQGFPGMSVYSNMNFASRSVMFMGESFGGYSLDDGHGGTALAQSLSVPTAGLLAWKNEPCLTGVYHQDFVKAYVGKNATFGESAFAAQQFLKTIDTAFGLAWMTLR